MTRELISLKYFYSDNFFYQSIKNIFYPIFDIMIYIIFMEHFSFLIIPIWFNHFILITSFIIGLTSPKKRYDNIIFIIEKLRILLFTIFILYLVVFKSVYLPKINIFLWIIPTSLYLSTFMIYILQKKKYF